MYDSIIQLYNATQSITNRTVIVHLFRDDGGQGGFPDSTTTGYDYIINFFKKKNFIYCRYRNAGARILCGLVKSNAFIIKPTISVLFMTIILIFIKLF
jgi:hypothetical protein